MQKIAIIDYGMGNINSVKKQFEKLGATVIVTSDDQVILTADKVLLPGFGHFGKAMDNLKDLNLIDTLNEFVLMQKKPIMGICLGMQIMAKHSEEGNTKGFGWIDAKIEKFRVNDTLTFKVPHVGWNTANITKNSNLFSSIKDDDLFYFVHSYHAVMEAKEQALTTTNYSYNFTSSFEKSNIFGVQFHPEKSHNAGTQLLKNFIQL